MLKLEETGNNEKALIAGLKEGDIECFGTLFRKYYPAFFAFVRGVSSISGNSTPLYVVDGIPAESYPNINAVDIVEIDVPMTSDSVLIVMHDRRADRTTKAKGLVSDLKWTDLGKFRDRERAKRQPANNKHCSSGHATMMSAQFQKSCATLCEGDATVFIYRAENIRNRHGFNCPKDRPRI